MSSDVNGDPTQHKQHFPDFIWLLRNVIDLPEDEDGNEIPLKTYVLSEVACSTQQTRLVSETLQAVFPSIEYLYLPQPSADPADIVNLHNCWNRLEDEFKDKIEEIEQYLLKNVRPKFFFDHGRFVTGVDLALLLRNHVNTINTHNCLPNLEQSWVAVMKLRLRDIQSEVVDKYMREMEKKTSGLFPIEESVAVTQIYKCSLMQLHWSVFETCYSQMRQDITHLLPHHVSNDLNTYSQSLLDEFSHKVAEFGTDNLLETEIPKGGLLMRFVEQNYRHSKEMCVELWDGLFKESGIRDRVIKALNQSKAVDVSSDIAHLVEEYMVHAVGPAKQEVLEQKQAANDVGSMLVKVPGPPMNARLIGRDRNKQKIRWDPPAINSNAAKKYVVQTRIGGKGDWKDVATTDKCWVILDKQLKNGCIYRVTSWNDDEHCKGEMEEPLVAKLPEITSTEELTYV